MLGLVLWVIKCTQILPKLELLYGLYLSVIGGVEVSLCCSNVRMTQKTLNRLEVNPFIQKSRGKGVPGYVRMDSFANQSPFCHRFNQAINSLWGKASLFIGSMLAQGVEHRIIRTDSVLRSL